MTVQPRTGAAVSSLSKDWPWWWSKDSERYWGPCSSRAEAIMEAWAEGETGSVHVLQAAHGELCTDIARADLLAEWFDDANQEVADGDGDAPSSAIPAEDWDALAVSISRQVAALVRKHGVMPWGFSGQTSGEWVELSPPLLAAMPAEARAILADLAVGFADGGVSPHYLASEVERLKVVLAPSVESSETASAEAKSLGSQKK